MVTEFWTSTEYSGFLAELMAEMNDAGLETRQRFLISEASYRGARSTPARLWLRLQQYAVYPLYLTGSLLFGKKAEVVVVCTNTFYAPWLATFFHKRVVHLVYDLFPEAMAPEVGSQPARAFPARKRPGRSVVNPERSRREGGSRMSVEDPERVKRVEGEVKARESLLHRMIRKIVASTLKRAEMNVFLGERLQAYVESVYGKVENGVVIPVGASSFAGEVIGEVGKLGIEGGELREAPVGEVVPLAVDERQLGQATSLADEGSKLACPKDASAARGTSSPTAQPITILYCGNLGRMHDLKTLKAFWGGWRAPARRMPQRPGDTPVPAENSEDETGLGSDSARAGVPALRFLFHCNGPKKQELIDMVAALGLDKSPSPDFRSPTSDLRPPISISIQGSLGSGEWREVMLSSQVALVTMVPGAENVVMPSKTYSAMMAGQAILAIAPEGSDLVDTIKAADCGWWVAPEVGGRLPEGRPSGQGRSEVGSRIAEDEMERGHSCPREGLAAVIQEIVSNPEELARKRANARAYAEAHFSMKVLAQEWARILHSE